MSRAKKIALLDYGMGNLHSASKALSAVGAEVSITNDPKVVAAADKIFFPGVGAMRDCIAGMHEAGIDDVIRQAIFNKPVMAICVGMQALFEQSAENGGTPCLSILDGTVPAFDRSIFWVKSPGKKPNFSPASTAGRTSKMRSISLRSIISTAQATAR